MASGQIRGHEAPGELGGTSPPLLEAWLARHLICFLRKHLPLETGWIVNEDSVSCTLGPVFYTWVTRSRSESTSQFTVLALNKPSSSTSSSSPLPPPPFPYSCVYSSVFRILLAANFSSSSRAARCFEASWRLASSCICLL